MVSGRQSLSLVWFEVEAEVVCCVVAFRFPLSFFPTFATQKLMSSKLISCIGAAAATLPAMAGVCRWVMAHLKPPVGTL